MKPVRQVTWDEVYEAATQVVATRLSGELPPPIRIFGIPRGGIYAAQACKAVAPSKVKIVENPWEADLLVDDIWDTGTTAKEWGQKYGKIVAPLFGPRDLNEYGWLEFPWERAQQETGPEENIRRILEFIGEDPNREGLRETPKRVIRSYDRLFGGYKQKVEDVLKVFEDDSSDQMVILKNIEFYSTCEHHMIPFSGKAHIAYLPKGKVVGISKLARILEVYARRLQIQERLAQDITRALMTHLEPLGAACMLEAQHMCMTARGVEKQGSIMVTSSLEGVFRDDPSVRAEFLSLIARR